MLIFFREAWNQNDCQRNDNNRSKLRDHTLYIGSHTNSVTAETRDTLPSDFLGFTLAAAQLGLVII